MYDLIAKSKLTYTGKRTQVVIEYRPMTTFLKAYIRGQWASIAGQLSGIETIGEMKRSGQSDDDIGRYVIDNGVDVDAISTMTATVSDVVIRYCITAFSGIENAPELALDEEKTLIGGYPVALISQESLEPFLAGDLGLDIAEFAQEVQAKGDPDDSEKNE